MIGKKKLLPFYTTIYFKIIKGTDRASFINLSYLEYFDRIHVSGILAKWFIYFIII